MEATVTLKVTPAEFDVLRDAVAAQKNIADAELKDLRGADRHEASARAYRLSEILTRLQS